VNGLPATLGATGNATVSVSGTWPSGITLDTNTGAISVTQGTTPGTYSVTYQLCDKLTPQTCSSTTDYITVNPIVEPITESGTVDANGGIAITNITTNDKVNGLPATLGTTGNAAVSVSGTWPTGITLNTTTGAVNVADGTTAGVYSIVYQLCDKLTPQSCKTMTDIVTVIEINNPPLAKNDIAMTPEDTPISFNILTNDYDKDYDLNPSSIDLDISMPGIQSSKTISGQGTFTVTDAGVVTFTPVLNFSGEVTPVTYQVCDFGVPLPVLCTTADILVTVTPVNDPPIAGVMTMAVQDNPGGNNYLPVSPTSFSGTDVDGTISSVKITSMPTNVTSIQINNVTYTSIPSGGITIPTDATGHLLWDVAIDPLPGSVTVLISYYVVDNSGLISVSPGSVTIPFALLSISGTVFIDSNGLNDNIVNGTPTNPDGAIYANLTDVTGKVISSKKVEGDGKYSFTEADGVTLNSSYKLVLSDGIVAVGSTITSARYPKGIVSSGENIGLAEGSDGFIDGSIAVNTSAGNVINANFGIAGEMLVDAGADASICATDGKYTLEGKTTNVGKMLWTTSGTGTFSDPAILNPVYSASSTDLEGGSVTITLTGQYVFNPLVQASSSMVLHLTPKAVVNAGADINSCDVNVISLAAAKALFASSILWKTSGSGTFSNTTTLNTVYTPSISDVQKGAVTLTLTALSDSPCDQTQDECVISFTRKATANAGPDFRICYGEPVIIGSASAKDYLSVSWSTNGKGTLSYENTMQPHYVPAPGETGKVQFILTALSNTDCNASISRDTVNILYQQELLVEITKPKTIPYNTEVSLNATASGGSGNYTYSWEPANLVSNPNSGSPQTLIMQESKLFTVTVTDETTGCETQKDVMITVEENIDKMLKSYNGISPDGDGINDFWWIDGIEEFPDNEVLIFNRWGDKIIELRNYDNNNVVWGGLNRQGKRVPDGTYYYILKIKNLSKSYTGWINIRSGN